MGIEHEVMYGGEAHITTRTINGKKVMDIGMVDPGEFDLGVQDQRVTILVSTGVLIINDYEVSGGNELTINKGEKLEIRATGPATYLCFYYARDQFPGEHQPKSKEILIFCGK